MIFRQLFHHESSTYSYLLADEATKEALLIDPVAGEEDKLIRFLKELNLNLVVAIDTHTHADHITALGELRTRTGCQSMMGNESPATCTSAKFVDGQVIPFGGLHLQAIYTPGHTDDSYSFFIELGDNKMLFSGDTLLIRGTGRTDFQNGDPASAYKSLFDRLLQLPADTKVFPAHDYNGWNETTIGEERAHNPRLQVKSELEYVALMNSLHLPDPKMMDVAVPANQACGQLL